ncbi:MAG: MFS transporter [Oscillospiraceae bacterium]|nr:MFS transporter [Oscillospiraceae bacterium]
MGKIIEAILFPITWWKGTNLPEEKIRPWEGGIQLLAESLKGFMTGFTNMKDRLYLGQAEGKIPPNWKTVHDVAKISWDAVNDPLIGTYMDRKRYGEKIHRWVMRFNATFSPFFILIQCFNLGLTPLQRVILWTGVSMFADVMSTANAVSEAKIWAGITPLTAQRGVVQLCKTIGGQLAAAFKGIPTGLMGLKAFTGLTYYQTMIYGALIFTPLTILCRWLPSFAKQRVDFTAQVKAESETDEEASEQSAEKHYSLRESFAVVRHNRWFMMNTVVNLLRVFLPKTDEMFFYRFLIPAHMQIKIRGKEVGGEALWMMKNLVFGAPGLLLQPFALKAVSRFGDKINYIRLHTFVVIVTTAAKYIVGYNSWPRLIFNYFMDTTREIFDRWAPVPKGQLDFEMYDYVEWKTGLRSEGMTIAVDGMLNKLINNNVTSVIGNAVLDWTGFQGYDIPEQPQRFLDSVWPLMHIGKVVGEIIFLIALFWFKYPRDPKEVEAELIERRKLAMKMMEETDVEAVAIH